MFYNIDMNKLIKKSQVNDVLDLLEQMHPEAACALDHRNNFELIVAVALSAQTTDVSVNKVTPALFDKYPTPEALSKAEIAEVEQLIKTIGLYKNKAKNIVAMADMLVKEFDSTVPNTREELVKLPGVGRKTANVVMAEAFGEPAIAVDTHVFRVANRIGLCDEPTPEKTEQALMKVLPQDKWIRAHHLIIFHGRKICDARKPKCEDCLLSKMCIYNTK